MDLIEKQSTVLVVDDSEAIQTLLKAYLRDGGYNVMGAVDGVEALDVCLRNSVDLILLDIAMPKMDGFSLCERLQSEKRLRAIPVIMLSAREDMASKMRSFELGAVDYITKPVGRGELLARIHTHLAISRLTISLQNANRELLVQQQQLLQGLHAAADLQKHLLPRRVPDCKELRFASYFQPCQEVGGDIYNIQRLDSDHLAIYILDVSGHGFPAAMMTALATQALSGFAAITKKQGMDGRVESVTSPGEVIRELNKEFPMARFNRYMTIVYLLFNTKNSTFRYCCAGHPPVIHMTREGGITALDTGGPPAGMDGHWDEAEGCLNSGDRLFFYTDGFTEYSNEKGELYGTERFFNSMIGSRELPLKEAARSIIGELKQFGDQLDGNDDMTLLVVEKK
ncbi:serine phosphatase RsbU, regulator of sigma subunit [Desulfocapsa sulfexigens DSM 10523]|uniref:Serine phosphatase RsbU, regulator of sigma subunit n=1 Tax=Desulfocapsa sulfexigens (strain DSM 10523 / SB164P1) TaxID=1167006 RepID=M1ND77_DESSD|nr:SpoIIE family protein phosphatase [Desulfocapsa sulfexigens]AGF77714.1 serine phosphatase RsbU, regulator of sigma subunit [Desulfocapsa sulfexigens DSM 10523]